MVIHGRKLIILANGGAIAAAKSCTIDVDGELLPVTSQYGVGWRHYIAGKQEWRVTTSGLLPASQPHTAELLALASANNGGTYEPSRVFVHNVFEAQEDITINSRGLTFGKVNDNRTVSYTTYDTYSNTALCATLIAQMTDAARTRPSFLVSFDAFGATQELASKIETFYNISLPESFPVGTTARGALAIVGMNGASAFEYSYPVAYGTAGRSAHARMLFNGSSVVSDTPLRDALLRTGAEFELLMETDGYALDHLSGNAFCKKARVSGYVGGLAQGDFEFVGNGALT